MGEPLYFVPGGEKLFKIYLREILAILCTGKAVSGSRVGEHRGRRSITTLGEGWGSGAL